MISFIGQVPSGGALQLVLQANADATLIRVTRALDQAALTNENAGTKVFEGTDLSFLDGPGLVNGTQLWYRAFYLIGSVWLATPAVPQTPRASFADYSADPMGLVRDRIAAGLVELVRRTVANDSTPGARLSPARGSIPVLFGSPTFDNVSLPLVTMHMVDDGDTNRSIGEQVEPDTLGVDAIEAYEGWLSSVQISVCAWSSNYDERAALRKALKSIVIANLPVFHAAGLSQVGFRIGDQDDMESYQSPMYMALGTFTCLAPSVVGVSQELVDDVEVTINGGG